MYVTGQNNRGRYRSQQGFNINAQKPQPKQNLRPQKTNQGAIDQAVLHGLNKLTTMFEKEMGDMRSRMSDLELKNDRVLQQNSNLAENVGKHKQIACAWKLKAEERMQKYKEALNQVLQLIDNNNDLRTQNDDLQRQKIEFQDRMKILVDRNKIFEEGIKVLITEHEDLKDELTKCAEQSGIAEDFSSILEQYKEELDDDRWAEQRRNTIKAAMVLAYVASKM